MKRFVSSESICSLTCWFVSAEAGGAFQDQQEGAHIIRVHHPGRPGDGALPPREQSHATFQTVGAAAAGIAVPAAHFSTSAENLSTFELQHCDGSVLMMPGSKAQTPPRNHPPPPSCPLQTSATLSWQQTAQRRHCREKVSFLSSVKNQSDHTL